MKHLTLKIQYGFPDIDTTLYKYEIKEIFEAEHFRFTEYTTTLITRIDNLHTLRFEFNDNGELIYIFIWVNFICMKNGKKITLWKRHWWN